MTESNRPSNQRLCTCDPDFRPLTCQHRYAWSDCMREERAHLIDERDRLRAALTDLIRAYVNTLEAGRDRIASLGGTCDSVETMENADPAVRKAKAALAGVTDETTGEQAK